MADATENENECFILTREAAERLVVEALDAQFQEPEAFVRLLLKLSDQADQRGFKDAIRTLIRAAFDNSLAHSIPLEEYQQAIRQGQDPLEVARARLPDQRDPDL